MTGLLDPSLRVPPVPVDTADAPPLLDVNGRTVADDLDDVRRSAQRLLSAVDRQPSVLRIRAGEVLVEMEWAGERPATGAADAAQAAVAAVAALASPGALAPHPLALPGALSAYQAGAAAAAQPGAIAQVPPGGGTVAVAASGEAAAVAAAAPADGFADICASTVGTFYRSPEPGTAPFVSEGDHVRRGQQVAIIEVMKLMIPVEADRDGQIVAVHVTDGTSVEYGDRLLTLAPATRR